MRKFNSSRFVKLTNRKTVQTHWASDFFNQFANAWKFGDYLIRQIRAKNPVDANEKIEYIISKLWDNYPLF